MPVAYIATIHDKKGEFWKFAFMAIRSWPVADDPEGSVLSPAWGAVLEFKRMHATYFYQNGEAVYNVPWTSENVSLMTFEARGR